MTIDSPETPPIRQEEHPIPLEIKPVVNTLQQYRLLRDGLDTILPSAFPEALSGDHSLAIFPDGVTRMSLDVPEFLHVFKDHSSLSIELLEGLVPPLQVLHGIQGHEHALKETLLTRDAIDGIRLANLLLKYAHYWKLLSPDDKDLLLRAVKDRTIPPALYSDTEIRRIHGPYDDSMKKLEPARNTLREAILEGKKPLVEMFDDINLLYGAEPNSPRDFR